MNDRITFAKEKNSDILLSIHQNSLPNRKDINIKHGVGTYYYHNQAKPLAEHIQNNLLNHKIDMKKLKESIKIKNKK